jgi:hypothetical protein
MGGHENDRALRSEPGVGPAYDQFIVKDGDGYVFSNVFQNLGPAPDQRLAFGGLEGLREVDRPFQGDPGRTLGADCLKHSYHPVGHGSMQYLLAIDNGPFLCGERRGDAFVRHDIFPSFFSTNTYGFTIDRLAAGVARSF